MFLRRGRFRGRERDGNDRGGSQRRFERRGSAPASIEHGAAPGVSSAEDGYATNPRDSFQAAPPCSRRTTPSHWEGTSERSRRGVSRIFALSVQELNCRSPVDLMSQYGRGDCMSSCGVKPLGEVVSGPQSSPVGQTECEPPEQPDWGPSFRRQHSHKPTSCADDKGSGSGHLQRLDNRADCVDRSEKRFTGHRELSTHNSQGAPFQAVNDKTCRVRNVPSRQIPLDGKGSSNHPANSTPRRGALNNQRDEIDNQAPTSKPALRQRDICQSKPDRNAESFRAKSNVSVSRQQGCCCDSPEVAQVSSYLPPIGHRSDRKKSKKRRNSRSKKCFSSESEHNTSAENLGSRERVVDPKSKTANGWRRQPSSGHETSVEYLDRRERIVDPKIRTGDARRQHTNSEHDANAENNRERVVYSTEKVGIVRRRQNNLVDDKTVEYQRSRERVVDFGKKTHGARRGQNNSDIKAENLGSREKISDPKMTTDVGQRRQANSENGTQFERFVSRDKTAEPKQKPGGGRRRQISSGHGTHVDNLGSNERIVDHELEIGSERRRRQNNTEQGPFAANLSSREHVVDCKEKADTGRGRQDNSERGTHASKRGRRGRAFDPKVNHNGGQRKQTNSEHGTNADNLAARERVVDPKEKTDGGQRKPVRSDHEINVEILGSTSRERVGDPKMKTGFGQRRPTSSERRRRVEKLNGGDRVVDPKKKAGDARGRHTNLHRGTAAADMSSSERVVEPNGMQRKQTHSAHSAHAEVSPKDSLVDPKKDVQRKKGSSTNAARHELGQYQRMTGWPTEPEDEDDWNMDHYGLSDMSPLTTALPVTLERPPCGSDDTVTLCGDKDSGERSHVTVCDIDAEIDVTSHETSHKYHHNDSDGTSCHNTDTSVCPQVVTVDDRHLTAEPPLSDDVVIFSHCHAEDTVTRHDLTASDSYTQVVDSGSSFYLSAAAHTYQRPCMRPCVRRASPVSRPSWGHRRSSYDYLPVMSISPPEDTEEDVTRVNAFKRHKTGIQDCQTENMNHSPPDMLPCPRYPGCAPCPAVCSPRPRYGTPPPPPPPPQWFLTGGGPRSSAPLPDLMFFDNSGHMWPKPPGYQPREDWYSQTSPPQGWYAPVRFQVDMPHTVNNTAPVSTAPVSTANPLVQDLQLLASCLVPPPPPPSTPPSEHTPDTRQSEEKPTSGCYSTWPKTQPVAASYVARPPCRVIHYGAPSVRYESPSSSSATSSGGAQNNVETTKTSPHHDDNMRNVRLRNHDSLTVINEADLGVASSTISNPTQPITSHEFADAVFSNYTLVNDGNQKQLADREPSAKSPTNQNDAHMVVSQYNGDDSLTDDSLMHHCADMAISMATPPENPQQGTAESRGKVKFRVAHYVPPTMRLSSSFSIVSSAESVSRMARSPKDVNMTLPCVGFSGSINSSPIVGGPEGSNQQSATPDKMRAIPRCSPYGPWQTTSTPVVTQAEPSAHTPDGATEFTFQTPRRRSVPDIQMRRQLLNVDATGVTSPRGFPKNNSVTTLTGAALNNNQRGVSCTSVSSSVDSDLNLCGLGSSVESSPCTSQRVSRFSCCSVSSNNSQETWSELSVSFDDVASPGKVDVTDPVQCGKKEEGEIDWFDGECRPSTEKSHNRYEMFPEKRDTANASSTSYGGSYGGELQANYTNPVRNKWNLPPRMQRLLQESASASRAQSLISKIQQPGSAYSEPHGEHTSSWQSFDWRSKLKDIFERSSERFLDSHCHLDFLFDRVNFKGTFKKYVAMNEETFCDKFAGCVTVFCHPHTFTTEAGMWMDVLREDNVWGAVGCHPKCATNFTARAERAMKVMLKHDKMVAVGEIGLDYSGTFYQHQEAQKEVLARQLKLATEINKPIVIHSRESESDIISELEKHIPRNHKIHRHCFTGTWEEARTWLHKFPNSYIGLTALLTHRSRRAFPLKDVARYIPLDKLLIETDTPYFVPWRIPKTDMEFCHPGMVITVADEVARLKGIHIDVVLKASYENTRDMYGI